jgi:hypothetical protein
MAELRIAYLMPNASHQRAVFVTDYGLRGGRLVVGDDVVVEAHDHEELARGVSAALPATGELVEVRASDDFDVFVRVGGAEALREDRIAEGRRRATWIHGGVSLGGSACGFAASWLYVLRARAAADPWAMKMAIHMAAWHLLLTLALFPAAVWGGRFGRHAVRGTALVFFFIHVGIAMANGGTAEEQGGWIAVLNAASGLLFLATATMPVKRAPRQPGQPHRGTLT